MLANITYGTFLLFGSACILMGIYTVFCVPETKGVPLESVHLLFEGNIIRGCVKDTIPRYTRGRKLQNHHITNDDDDDDEVGGRGGQKGVAGSVRHIEAA